MVSKSLDPKSPKKLLSLDGGGIRGLITAEVLVELERMLRDLLGAGPEFRLSDYFDYVAGTSTGAILAAGIAIGLSAEELVRFYVEDGREMFSPASIFRRWTHYKFEDDQLAEMLQRVYGPETLLGSGSLPAMGRDEKPLKTLLMLVLQNATTDSPWPVSNNPRAKFNDPAEGFVTTATSNLRFPLWKLVRASTAAPSYFPPEALVVDEQSGEEYLFVDGGMTMYNNPAFLLYRMATMDEYRLGWDSGLEKMLLVSVGTGTYSSSTMADLTAFKMHNLRTALTAPASFMYGALNEQDYLCRTFGKCLCGDPLDLEVGDLVHREEASDDSRKLFTYVRYNVDLTQEGLAAIGMGDVNVDKVRPMDNVDAMPELQQIGQAVAATRLTPSHFQGFTG